MWWIKCYPFMVVLGRFYDMLSNLRQFMVVNKYIWPQTQFQTSTKLGRKLPYQISNKVNKHNNSSVFSRYLMHYLWLSLTKAICSSYEFSQIITNIKGEQVQDFPYTHTILYHPNLFRPRVHLRAMFIL